MQLTITTELLKQSTPESCSECVMALALMSHFEKLGEVSKIAVRHPNSDITVKGKGTWLFDHSTEVSEWLSYYDNFSAFVQSDDDNPKSHTWLKGFKEFNICISVYTENDMNTLIIHKDEYPPIDDDDLITPLDFEEIEKYAKVGGTVLYYE